MVFTSTIFLFIFLPAVLFTYYFANPKLRNVVLMVASLMFYAWGEPIHVILMILSIIVNYFLGIAIVKNKSPGWKKVFLIMAICFDLGLLLYFKYFNFFIDVLNDVFKAGIVYKNVALPIGISFYTFQIMSYVIDVYWGNVEAQENCLDLALYISLFPQLIAGPIVRYIDVEEQIKNRSVNFDKFYSGTVRFMKGFSKKVLIADQIAPLVDIAFSQQYPSCLLKWVGIIGYTLQIYFDFSGYSDMAIGMGKMFGFEFIENFNYPYISQSIKEFWRRWHISLSTWFRDYVYIPLGGSRCKKSRQYLNLIVVFFLTGFWHGASYNFIFWGLYYVVFLIIERMGLGKALDRCPAFLRHIYALFIILIGWVFFRADTLGNAFHYISGMFTWNAAALKDLIYVMNRQYWFCILAGCVLSTPIFRKWNSWGTNRYGLAFQDATTIAIFIIAICYMVGTGFSPFLYFRF